MSVSPSKNQILSSSPPPKQQLIPLAPQGFDAFRTPPSALATGADPQNINVTKVLSPYLDQSRTFKFQTRPGTKT